ELVQAKLGVRFRVAPAADLSEQLALAQAGELDVLTSLKRTPEREAFLAFTAPYVSVPAVIIVRRELAADLTLADLRGKRVTVGDGYGVHAWLSQRAPDLALEPVGNDLIGLRRVAFGEADAAIMDLASASWFIEHEGIGNLRVGGDTGYTYDLSFAVRKDLAPLRGILDKGLAQLSELERAEIRERWITLSGREYRLRRQLSLVLWFLGAVGLVALLVIGSNATLKRQVARRTAELAQRTRDAQALADAIPDLVLHLSAEGAVLALNAPPACSLGLASVEARGQPLSELALPAALHEGLLRGMRQALATGALCAQELSWDGPHGARVVDARAVPTGTQAVVWIVRNVTEQRAAERRQRELDEQAIHAQKLESLGVLAGGIAHDFNNLLATILGNTELARARLGPQDPAAERLQDVATAAERAAQLCRLLLAYAGRGEFRLTVLDLAAFVRDLENLLRASCAKSTALALELPAEPVWVEVDAGQLQQVLMNLVINGSEAIGEAPGQVTVRVRSAPWTADELATVAPERLPARGLRRARGRGHGAAWSPRSARGSSSRSSPRSSPAAAWACPCGARDPAAPARRDPGRERSRGGEPLRRARAAARGARRRGGGAPPRRSADRAGSRRDAPRRRRRGDPAPHDGGRPARRGLRRARSALGTRGPGAVRRPPRGPGGGARPDHARHERGPGVRRAAGDPPGPRAVRERLQRAGDRAPGRGPPRLRRLPLQALRDRRAPGPGPGHAPPVLDADSLGQAPPRSLHCASVRSKGAAMPVVRPLALLFAASILLGCPGGEPASSDSPSSSDRAPQPASRAAFYVEPGCAQCKELGEALPTAIASYAADVALEIRPYASLQAGPGGDEHVHQFEWPLKDDAVLDLSGVRVNVSQRNADGVPDPAGPATQLSLGVNKLHEPGALESSEGAAIAYEALRSELTVLANQQPELPVILTAAEGVPTPVIVEAVRRVAWAKTGRQPK
ncbi:MAG: transporter substrate-binding domain-containing protein, partial [Planctomycetota bacterium]